MSGWIKFEKELPKTVRFLRLLKAYRNALRGVTERDVTGDASLMLGALLQLWSYADSHIGDDNVLAITLDEINEIVGVQHFAQSLPTDWLKVIDADHVELPDFLEHNGTSARQRKNAAKRQANHRWKKKQLDVTRDVTHSHTRNDARPDQTRVDKTRPDVREDARATSDDFTEHAEWETVKALYPPGASRQDWIGAERAARRIAEDGTPWQAIRDGVERYAANCKATDMLVMNPVRFFTAADKPWSQAWPIPPPKKSFKQQQQDGVTERFLREAS